ncbi:MAG TPA: TonB-dependent receptor plug domain-containing protein [Gemmatimonadaceae bacterium]|nr:TonB-dependent receptor plug domain-containing protein [Gemmatimonadaceae bacterium]
MSKRRARAVICFVVALLGGARALAAQRTVSAPDSQPPKTAVPLSGSVPSVTGVARRAATTGRTAGVIEVDSMGQPPQGDLSDLLSSRLPGVLVQRPSGTTGSGARIYVRGFNSLALRNDPLLIVDGVRVDNATASTTLDVGGQRPSRLDDLDLTDIARIQVLRGPASAALFSGDAASGVILITTRRGGPWKARWKLHTEYGPVSEVTAYPPNIDRSVVNPRTDVRITCTLDRQALGVCEPGAVRVTDPLEDTSPFRRGSYQRHGLSVSGHMGGTGYYLAGDFDRENGVTINSARERTHLRANFGHPADAASGATVGWTFTGSYLDGTLHMPLGDLGGGVQAAAMDAYSADVSPNDDYQRPLPLLLGAMAVEDVHHLTIGGTGSWHPAPGFRSHVTVGMDRVMLSGDQMSETPNLSQPNTVLDLLADSGRYTGMRYTADLGASTAYDLTSTLAATTAFGVRYHRDRMDDSERRTDVIEGTSLFDETTLRENPWASALGAYLQQHVAWRDRLFLTVGASRDRERSQDSPSQVAWSSSADASWLVSAEPFFPHLGWLTSLRARVAYGRTTRTVGAPLTFATAGTSRWDVGDVLGRLITMQADERMREVETGLDATLFAGRATLALTYFDRRFHEPIPDLSSIFDANGLAPVDPLGDVRTVRDRGAEAQLQATLVQSRPLTLDLTLSAATNSSLLLPGSDVSPLVAIGVRQLARNGYPVGGYWQRPILAYEDRNGDGIISSANCPGQPQVTGGPPCEVQLGDTAVYLGSPLPRREFSIAPDVTLFGKVNLSALFDYRGGFVRYDETRAIRCLSVCRAVEDPTAPLADQAAAIAGSMGSDAGFIEDASFWKLREVALTLTAPSGWARHLGASDARLTLAARNLDTWTDYRGLDPEDDAYASDPISSAEYMTQPPVRYVTARLDVTW